MLLRTFIDKKRRNYENKLNTYRVKQRRTSC